MLLLLMVVLVRLMLLGSRRERLPLLGDIPLQAGERRGCALLWMLRLGAVMLE
jgi:hypothetical protein